MLGHLYVGIEMGKKYFSDMVELFQVAGSAKRTYLSMFTVSGLLSLQRISLEGSASGI